MIKSECFQKKWYFWIFWVGANAIGFALGWSAGETIGQLIGENINWPLGELIGWGTFQFSVWMMRASILHQVREFSNWRTLDSIIWFAAEILGWFIITRFAFLIEGDWIVAGAIWGSIFGAGAWLSIWLILEPWPKTVIGQMMTLIRRALFGSLGLVGGVLLGALFLVISLEYGNRLGEITHPTVGWIISGLILGALIGGATGAAFTIILKWPSQKK